MWCWRMNKLIGVLNRENPRWYEQTDLAVGNLVIEGLIKLDQRWATEIAQDLLARDQWKLGHPCDSGFTVFPSQTVGGRA